MRKALLLMLVALLMVSGAALAQDAPAVLCGKLSEADCAILEQSQVAMQSVTAAAVDGSIDIEVQAEGQTTPINIAINGAFTGMSHEQATGDAPSIEEVVTAIQEFNGALTINLTVPPEMAAGADFPNTLSLELRLVDGIGYLNLDPLQPLLGAEAPSGWGGLNLAELVSALMEQITPEMLQQMTEDMQMFGEGMTSGMEMGMMWAERFSDPEFLSEHVTVERVDDGSSAIATFATTFDFSGVLDDPAFQDLLREQIQTQAAAQGDELSDADLETALNMTRDMVEGMTISTIEDIDTTTGYLVSMNFALGMDMSGMMSASGSSSSDPTAFHVVVAFNFNYDDVPMIEAPADAQIVPTEDVLDMFSGMMGMMGGMNQ